MRVEPLSPPRGALERGPAFLRRLLARVGGTETGKRLAHGLFWSVAGVVISRGLALAASVIVAQRLGKSGYGEFGIIQSTVGMFGVFAGFGLGLTATKHVAEFRRTDPQRAARVIGLSAQVSLATGGAMALALLVLAPWLAAHTLNAPQLAGLLRIGALILLLSALNGAQTGALSGMEAFRTIARVNLCVGALSFPIMVAGVWWAGLPGAVWALALNLGINWTANHLALRREARRRGMTLRLRGSLAELPMLWRFSLPAVLASALVGPVNWACNAMMVNQPHGYGEMGIFNAANQWFAILMFLPNLLGSVVLPVLSERFGQQGADESGRLLGLTIKANACIVLPVVVLASLFSPAIMRLYGAGFAAGWPALVLTLYTAGVLAVQIPVAQVITASGRMWAACLTNLAWASVFLITTQFSIRWGAVGLAGARALSYTLHGIWTLAYAHYLLRTLRNAPAR